jgi:hypothetical protein
MYHLIVYAVIAAFGLLSVTMQKDIQRRVARWLRQNGLAKSALMDAVVFLDMVGSAIRARVKVTTRSQHTELLTMEKTYSMDQIPDPQVRAALEQRGHAEQNVMTLFSTT